MSLTAACGWTLLRSLLIAVLALPAMSRLRWLLAGSSGRSLWFLWPALLIVFLTPDLLIGYAYSSFSLSLVHYPAGNELLYSLLLLLKLVPVGTAVLYFSPAPPVSAEAFFCAKLSLRDPRRLRARCRGFWTLATRLWILRGCWIRGPARSAFPALAVVFLLAFQEFEMASLMGATAGTVHTPASWTVHLYDAQAGGLMLADSLQLVLLPVACESAILIPLLVAVLASHRVPAAESERDRTVPARQRIVLWSAAAIAGIAVCVVPLILVLQGTAQGLPVLLEHLRFGKEILRSLLLAFICGTCAYMIASWFLGHHRTKRGNRPRIVTGFVVSLPGLSGSLILGLAALAVFQHPWLNHVYDTSLPFITTMILFLLPRALLLQILLHAVRPAVAGHLTMLLRQSPLRNQRDAGRELLWKTQLRGHFWGVVLVCYWAYWDLTLASLLLPPGMAAAPLRLYNLMHYGQSAVHSAMLFVTIVIPMLMVLTLSAARRPILRWLVR